LVEQFQEIEVTTFNAKKLIDDCGGVRAVAEQLGKARTAPYRMIRTRFMTTHQLETLMQNNPTINLTTNYT